MPIPQSTPVAYPKVAVGGIDYLVRFGFGALYELNGRGFNVAKTKEAAQQYQDKDQWLRLMVDLGSCGLGNFINGKWVSQPMTAMELADALQDAEFQPFCEAVQESFWGKPSPAPVPDAAAGADPTDSTKTGSSTPGASPSPDPVSA